MQRQDTRNSIVVFVRRTSQKSTKTQQHRRFETRGATNTGIDASIAPPHSTLAAGACARLDEAFRQQCPNASRLRRSVDCVRPASPSSNAASQATERARPFDQRRRSSRRVVSRQPRRPPTPRPARARSAAGVPTACGPAARDPWPVGTRPRRLITRIRAANCTTLSGCRGAPRSKGGPPRAREARHWPAWPGSGTRQTRPGADAADAPAAAVSRLTQIGHQILGYPSGISRGV